MVLAYKFFFSGVPDNQQLSVPWQANSGPRAVWGKAFKARQGGFGRLADMISQPSRVGLGLGRAAGAF
jgi:hypothetical protein